MKKCRLQAENARKSDSREVPSKKRRRDPSPLRLQPPGRASPLGTSSCCFLASLGRVAWILPTLRPSFRAFPLRGLAQLPGTGISECDDMFKVSAKLLVSSSASSLLGNFRGARKCCGTSWSACISPPPVMSCLTYLASCDFSGAGGVAAHEEMLSSGREGQEI